MLKLFKYEMRKTLMVKLILLGLTVGMEALFLYGIYGNKQGSAILGITLLVITAIVGTLFVGIHSVTTLHHDMNTKQSYMLFMTPNSNYAILGAKSLEAMLSLLIAGVVFFGVAVIDFNILIDKFADAKEALDLLNELKNMFLADVELSVPVIAAFTVSTAASWYETIMLAFLADVLATAILKGKKFGLLVTFLFFVALTFISNKIVSILPAFSSNIVHYLVGAVVMLVISAGVYVVTSTVMDKKLSV